jgi:hypothetical protein
MNYDVNYLRMSHSTHELFDGCERKFELRKMYKTADRVKELAPEIGSVLHNAFQDWLVHKDEERAVWRMLKEYPYELEPTIDNPRSLEACYSTLMALLSGFNTDAYEIAQITVPGRGTIPCIEVPFQFNLMQHGKPFYLDPEKEEMPVIYVGKIDAMLYKVEDQTYSTTDVKTTRQNMDMSARYAFDEQTIPYGVVLQHILGMELDSFEVNYLSAYVDVEKPTVHIYPYQRLQTDVQDWAMRLLLDLEKIRFMYQNMWFPRRPGHCVSFNKTCEFFDICPSRDKEQISHYLLAGHEPRKEEPWDAWIEIDLEIGG